MNEALLQILVPELGEYLERMDGFFSESLDKEAGREEVFSINDTIHNMKGLGGMVELFELSDIAGFLLDYLHEAAKHQTDAETIRQKTKNTRACLHEIHGALKNENLEQLSSIFERFENAKIPIEAEFESLETEKEQATLEPYSEHLKNIFLEESAGNLEDIEEAVGQILEQPERHLKHTKLGLHFANMKSSASILHLSEMADILDFLTETIESLQENMIPFDDDAKGVLTKGVETLKEMLEAIKADKRDLTPISDNYFLAIESTASPVLARHDSKRRKTAHKKKSGQAQAQESKAISQDEIKTKLSAVFMIEGQEHLQALSDYILQAETGQADKELLHKIFRVVHTLKGAASTVGFDGLTKAAHRFEDVLEACRDKNTPIDDSFMRLLYEGQAVLGRLLAISTEAPKLAEEEAEKFIEILKLFEKDPKEFDRALLPKKQRTEERKRKAPLPDLPAAETATSKQNDEKSLQTIRVSMQRIERLMTMIGQLNSYQLRLDDIVQTYHDTAAKLKWDRKMLTQQVAQFQKKYQYELPLLAQGAEGGEEFTDLEMDRYTDSAVFARTMEDLDFRIGNSVRAIDAQMNLIEEEGMSFSSMLRIIKDEITKVRLTPISVLYRAIQYQVYSLARDLKKKARLEFIGEETELDKAIIDKLGDAILHIIRNCLDHGIESPQKRVQKGKDMEGVIRISAMQDLKTVQVVIEDDGAGMDLETIRKRAVEAGFFTKEQSFTLSEEEVIAQVFHPAISAKSKTSGVSGRGVGMDYVRHAIAKMYGSISIQTKKDEGTRFSLKLPLTLALQSVVTIHCDQYKLNIPMSYLDAILLKEDAIENVDTESQTARFEEEEVKLYWLAEFFGISPDKTISNTPILHLKYGDQSMALAVDQVEESEEAMIRPVASLLAENPLFLGNTMTGRGEVRLVLNVPMLFEFRHIPKVLERRLKNSERKQIRVLIADDSLSVRQTIKLMLEKHGARVNTAKDGLVAWQKMNHLRPDIAIVDLEMPDINGFELMAMMRRTPEFQTTPIIVLTSRAGKKHRDKARELGANAFLTKPVLEANLIDTMRVSLSKEKRAIFDLADTSE